MLWPQAVMAAKGYFVVFRDSQDRRQIHFKLASAEAGDAPDDQLSLKSDVESTLTSIQLLYPQNDEAFESAFRQLLSLAQVGLVGENAQPLVAARALVSFRAETLLREAGKIKNKYLRHLGRASAGLSIPALIIFLIGWLSAKNVLICFALLWVGAMIGVWLSFAHRKTRMTFEDLTLIEEDRLEPSIRLIFAGILTVLLGIIFYRTFLVVEVGTLTTQDVGKDALVSFLIGTFCGFSELILPSQFAKQASRLFEERGQP